MGVKMNFRIITKNHACDSKIRSPHKIDFRRNGTHDSHPTAWELSWMKKSIFEFLILELRVRKGFLVEKGKFLVGDSRKSVLIKFTRASKFRSLAWFKRESNTNFSSFSPTSIISVSSGHSKSLFGCLFYGLLNSRNF